jgi:hypothetical protein
LTGYVRPGGFIDPTRVPFGWREYELHLPFAHDTGVNIGESILFLIKNVPLNKILIG